ncbi:C-C motif chemokine 14 [Tamandua tetradactyla]|uniref:C-C motif chemokine 14 n=1 Tax=Tamandua tetradactyla TaxID=48850 RepID=UPI004053ED39
MIISQHFLTPGASEAPRPALLLQCLSHRRMKFPVVAIFFLIISITLGSKTEKFSGPYHPAECCFSYITRRIPRLRVASYYETSSQCSKPGIVFVTTKGYTICANPSDSWVQDYIKDLEEN